jgi:hypothetical protein
MTALVGLAFAGVAMFAFIVGYIVGRGVNGWHGL